jgi:hypothetical protein
MHRFALLFLLVGCSSLFAQDMRLPFTGRWFVAQGGDTINVNHHMAERAQWFGADFAKLGGSSQRALSVANPSRLQDFYSWNEPVHSPVDGVVEGVIRDLPDNPLGTKDLNRPIGNQVVIKAGEKRFVFLAHFQHESITVAPGDRVRAGQVLGRCGNSGNPDYPHIHLHVQDALTGEATGQNPIFSDMSVELTSKKFDNVTWPVIRGLFLTAN